MWKSVGNYVDGWAKFAVTLGALGWFGLQIAERSVPRSATITVGTHDPPAVEKAASTFDVTPAIVPTRTAFGELAAELAVTGRDVAGHSQTHVFAALLFGALSGLLLRPRVNDWRAARALRNARRRADRHAEDLRLLAAASAKNNSPGPNIAPLKRH